VESFLLANQSAIYAYLFLGTLGAVALWEHVAPKRDLRASMQVRWVGNFGLLLINAALSWVIYPGVGIGAAIVASGQNWGLLRLVEMPYWLGFLLSIVLLDLGHFGIHYLFHRVPVLWRMHRLHHTDQDFDFTTGVRFHPAEAVLEQGANLAVIVIVGPPVLAVMLFVFSYLLTTFWVHGNVRMPANWDRRIRRVLVTPDMHRTHHSQVEAETNSNYGGLFSCWDRLFGTYVDEPKAGHKGMAIGLPEFRDGRHIKLGWMLANPVLNPSRIHEADREVGAAVRR
jgi:sterol desaturase/sphingolipid hydroxylase (fatty acid hydroxylase superfamily)